MPLIVATAYAPSRFDDIAALTRDFTALVDSTADSPDDEHDPEGATIAFERPYSAAASARSCS